MLVARRWLGSGIVRVFPPLAVVVMNPRAAGRFTVLKRCLGLSPVEQRLGRRYSGGAPLGRLSGRRRLTCHRHDGESDHTHRSQLPHLGFLHRANARHITPDDS
jgi:hypothetical protein